MHMMLTLVLLSAIPIRPASYYTWFVAADLLQLLTCVHNTLGSHCCMKQYHKQCKVGGKAGHILILVSEAS